MMIKYSILLSALAIVSACSTQPRTSHERVIASTKGKVICEVNKIAGPDGHQSTTLKKIEKDRYEVLVDNITFGVAFHSNEDINLFIRNDDILIATETIPLSARQVRINNHIAKLSLTTNRAAGFQEEIRYNLVCTD